MKIEIIHRLPHLQPRPVNFAAGVFLQTVMRGVAHDSDDLAPRFVGAFKA